MKKRYDITVNDVVAWAKAYSGDKFHALLCDPPYHLTSIVKRFGSKGSAPAKHGTDGLFRRISAGFMGHTWDGGDVAFQSETWQALCEHLHPGSFGFAFASARGWHRLAVAIEDAGMIIYPSIFLWVYGQGMPKATRLRGSGDFSGHRYGLGVLKPATEPLIVFQKPYSGKPAEDMLATGSGALNIDGARVHGRWPANFIIVHSAECVMSGLKKGKGYTINRFVDGAKPFGGGAGHLYESEEFDDVYEDWNCVEGCPALELERQWPGSSRYFFNAQLENDPFALYIQKVNKTERGEDNDHPTLKPISLTTYLAKLLLPPDTYAPRRLLVPFSGAGSEVIGALSAGWEFVQGVEIVDAYAETSRKRIEEWTKKPMQGSLF